MLRLLRAQLLEPGPQQRLTVGVPVQPQVAGPVDRQQRVVETADGTWGVAVPHPLVERGAVHGAEDAPELVEGGDSQLEQES